MPEGNPLSAVHPDPVRIGTAVMQGFRHGARGARQVEIGRGTRMGQKSADSAHAGVQSPSNSAR